MVCSPDGVLSVTLYAARTEGRAVAARPATEVFLSRRAIAVRVGGVLGFVWGMQRRKDRGVKGDCVMRVIGVD